MLPPYWPPSLPGTTPILFWHLPNTPLAEKFLPWDQFLNIGSERLKQLPIDTQLLNKGRGGSRAGWLN